MALLQYYFPWLMKQEGPALRLNQLSLKVIVGLLKSAVLLGFNYPRSDLFSAFSN